MKMINMYVYKNMVAKSKVSNIIIQLLTTRIYNSNRKVEKYVQKAIERNNIMIEN